MRLPASPPRGISPREAAGSNQSSCAGYLLKAFPDWIAHDDEPNVTAEVVS
jgi:hypothetical protein